MSIGRIKREDFGSCISVKNKKGGFWFLHISLEYDSTLSTLTEKLKKEEVIAVDVGENNIAAVSSGKVWKAGELKHKRDKYLGLRARLQSNGSQSARQHLRKASGKERRHVTHVNHVVSKSIVEEAAKQKAKVIVLEDLTHIRDRVRAGKRVRSRLHRWSFRELQQLSNVCGSSVYLTDVFGVFAIRQTNETPFCLSALWSPCAQRLECKSESAGIRLSADSPRAVVNRPNVELLCNYDK